MPGTSRIEFRLDQALKKRGKTRYWLSQVSGISETGLYKMQSGRTGSIRYETLAIICDILDCEPAELLVRVPDK